MIDQKTKADLQKKLEKTKSQLDTELAELGKPVNMSGGEIDAMDSEADEAEELSANEGMAISLKQRHEDVVAALGKMAKGTYGTCESCGNEIELALLKVDPESRYCKSCKAKKQ